jgi:hypothetical protein
MGNEESLYSNHFDRRSFGSKTVTRGFLDFPKRERTIYKFPGIWDLDKGERSYRYRMTSENGDCTIY